MSTNKKTARKYNNRKGQGKGRDPKDYTLKEEVEKVEKGKNDIAWYSKSETLLREAASITWSWSTGRPITLNGPYDTAPGVSYRHVVPGIFAVRTALTPGTGFTASDAINIAAQALYTDIRRMLKSANQYEASDVMIYVCAVGEIMAYISWLTRLYATTMMYSYRNSYLPDDLIRVQGVDPEDLHNNALEFLSRANQLIAKASQIYLPKGFAYLDRCKFEYANYYSEGNDIKDQIYLLTPALFRSFTLSSSEDYKGILTPTIKITKDSNLKVSDLMLQLESMIDALIGDSDFANIAGDLMNRYGEGGVETFALIPQNAVMEIITGSAAYEVLEQIQNSRIMRPVFFQWYNWDADNLDMFRLKQGAYGHDNQYLAVNTFFTMDTSTTVKRNEFIADAIDTLLTVHEDPNPAKTMSITRMTNMIYGVEDAVTEVSGWIEAGATYVIEYDVVWHDTDMSYQSDFLVSSYTDDSTGNDKKLLRLRPFHYAPQFYLYHNEAEGMDSVMGSLDIVAPITAIQLQDVNRVAMMSMFAVPDIGKVNGK